MLAVPPSLNDWRTSMRTAAPTATPLPTAPLSLTNYKRTIKGTGEGENCNVEWPSDFAGASDGDAMEAVRGIYQAGFDNLQKMFGGN